MSTCAPLSSRYSRRTSAAAVSFPGGLVVSTRIRSCRSSVTSSRSETVTLTSTFLFLCTRRQLVPCPPERREEVVVDHLSEHLDRCPLRPDDLVADDSRHDLVVADPPHRDPLVPLDQGLGELVEPFVLASADVDLDDVEPGRRDRLLECRAERRRHAAHLAEPRRVEAAAVTEHAPDLLVLPRGHLLE